MDKYPEIVTERFDDANFHINYCLKFIKKYLKGNILEVGAGCGSFTKNYLDQIENNKITLTELDKKNIDDLKERFKNNKNIEVSDKSIEKIQNKFDTILYLHVLEHIKNDKTEIKNAIDKLNDGGIIIFMVPAHQKIYSNLDKAVGHYRRYSGEFFSKTLISLERINFKYLDAIGYFLYFLNKIFFKKETYPSKFKIFLWDKVFTPITIIVDFFLRYKFGKCIIAVYKKNS
jgi:SAM-dependent methyltransferase|tara:strand:+ start:1450 stop:2142 length:693 start_codon:yes stop_codon:yes gene_type:complete